jgi:hypothetical protein
MRYLIFFVTLIMVIPSYAAKISVLEGLAHYKNKGTQSIWKKLTAGQSIQKGTQIKTSKNSKVFIKNNDNIIKLFANSTIRFNGFKDTKKTSAIKLLQGFLWAKVEKDPKQTKIKFSIKTKHAVAGVRGTKFAVSSNENKSLICVCEGAVDVKNFQDNKSNTFKVSQGAAVSAMGTDSHDYSKMFEKGIANDNFIDLSKKMTAYKQCLICHAPKKTAVIDKRFLKIRNF